MISVLQAGIAEAVNRQFIAESHVDQLHTSKTSVSPSPSVLMHGHSRLGYGEVGSVAEATATASTTSKTSGARRDALTIREFRGALTRPP